MKWTTKGNDYERTDCGCESCLSGSLSPAPLGMICGCDEWGKGGDLSHVHNFFFGDGVDREKGGKETGRTKVWEEQKGSRVLWLLWRTKSAGRRGDREEMVEGTATATAINLSAASASKPTIRTEKKGKGPPRMRGKHIRMMRGNEIHWTLSPQKILGR